MAATPLTVDVRARRLWLFRVANVLIRLPMTQRHRHAIVYWSWGRVRFEYRCGGAWVPLRKPKLELD